MNLDLSIVSQYKKQVASKLIPIKGDRIAELITESSTYYVSEKLDGFLCLVACDGKSTLFFDQSGTELNLKHLVTVFPKDAVGIWAGELYVSNGRSRSFLVASAISKEPEALALGIFDRVDIPKDSIDERYNLVKKSFPEKGTIHGITVEHFTSRKSILDRFDSVVSAGGEGIVVHSSEGAGYKIKPLQFIDCIVIGFAVRENKQEIRELLLGLATQNGYVVIGKVGTGFSELDRKEWFQRLEKIKVNSDSLEIAGNGLAFHWVKPEIVVEISYQEIIYENANSLIRKTELGFVNNQYSAVRLSQSFSLIHPVFEQIRFDKKPIIDHCGFSQISFQDKELTDSNSNLSLSKEATCIERQVFIKSGKGGKALRKFTIWKSPEDDKKRSPYLVYFTDFSAGRKEPLQTELYLAKSEEAARKRVADLIEENIKKGWEKL